MPPCVAFHFVGRFAKLGRYILLVKWVMLGIEKHPVTWATRYIVWDETGERLRLKLLEDVPIALQESTWQVNAMHLSCAVCISHAF